MKFTAVSDLESPVESMCESLRLRLPAVDPAYAGVTSLDLWGTLERGHSPGHADKLERCVGGKRLLPSANCLLPTFNF